MPEPAHDDLQDGHVYKIGYKSDLKTEFLQFNEKSRMFSIAESSTTVANIGEYKITVTLEDEFGVQSSPELQLTLKIVSIESLIGEI